MTGARTSPTAVANGRYRLVRVIGKGGMATVWRGYDQWLDRDVAIKVVEFESSGPDASDVLREAKAAARLRHPYITEVYDVGTQYLSGGRAMGYVVMELIDGETLLSLIGHGKALPARPATGLAYQMAVALSVAHSAGIVHRDVSPSNVMVTRHGVKVLDFGIATTQGAAQRNRSGLVHANPRYVAPERLAEPDRPVAPACDIYSLGILWYRLLTGRLPWDAVAEDELIEAHINWDPEPLPTTVDLPPPLKKLCLQCLTKHPSRRPTAADLVSALRDYRDVDVVDAAVAAGGTEPETLVAERSRRRPALVAFLLALLTVAGFALWSQRGQFPDISPSTPHDPGRGAGSAPPTVVSSTAGGAGASGGAPAGGPNAGPSTSQASSGSSAGPTSGPTAPTGPTPGSSGTAASVQITGVGGVILVLCVGGGGEAEVILATPALLYIVGDHDYGPADAVHVTFDSLTHTTTIRATCSAGVVSPQVSEGQAAHSLPEVGPNNSAELD